MVTGVAALLPRTRYGEIDSKNVFLRQAATGGSKWPKKMTDGKKLPLLTAGDIKVRVDK